MDITKFNEVDFTYILNYFKNSYSELPNDYVLQMRNQSKYELLVMDNRLMIGYDSGLEQVIESLRYSYMYGRVLKLGVIENLGDIVYSDISGSFKIYYMNNQFSKHIDNLEYICDTFTELITLSKDVLYFFNKVDSVNPLFLKLPLYKVTANRFSPYDFKLIKNMLNSKILPQDFIDVFSYNCNFRVLIDDSLELTFGSFSGEDLCLDYNSLSITTPHTTLVIGIDGYGNSILYSNKDGIYKIYVVADSYFDETQFVYLADNLYELLIDHKNIDILLDF